jgi:DNA-3-methyladenine glycosylase I
MAVTYCEYVKKQGQDDPHKIYHDTEYGFPIHDDNLLLERLALEINQTGLNWGIILNKKDNFHKAFNNFDLNKVAAYKEKQIERLLSDAGIIRNRLKINAVIKNAGIIKQIQKEFGSFENWLLKNHPLTKDEWVKLFKKNFTFTGGEIVNEFLMSIGYLSNAHEPSCPVYKKILKLNPAWKSIK